MRKTIVGACLTLALLSVGTATALPDLPERTLTVMVSDAAQRPLENAQVSDGSGHTVLTDNRGISTLRFTALQWPSTYTITASKSGYVTMSTRWNAAPLLGPDEIEFALPKTTSP